MDIASDLIKHLHDEELLEKAADFFKVFGDYTRLRIIIFIMEEERPVKTIADSLKMTQSAISHQLRMLKGNKVVKSRRDGKNIYYSLDDEHVSHIILQGFKHIAHTHN